MDRARKGTELRAASPDDPVEVALVDPFAGADHPLPPGELPLAVAALQRLLAPARSEPSRARAFLVEEDPVKVDWLLHACRAAGLASRTAAIRGDASPGGEISVIEGGWAEGAARWSGAADAPAGLALLDPPRAERLPLERFLSLLRELPAIDLLLRFPIADLRRLEAFRGVPLADLPPYPRRSADGISRLLNDPRHEWALALRAGDAAPGSAAAEAAVVGRLAERVRGESGRLVRVFAVPTGEREEYFLLASREAGTALLINEVLFVERSAGRLPWPEEEVDFVRLLPRAELELFGGVGGKAGGAEGRERVVDLAGLAHALAGRFEGRRVRLREVLALVVESDLFVSDVRRALSALRRDGRALYRSLSSADSEIVFPRAGAARPGRRGSSRRASPAPDELSLFGEAEGE